MCVICFKPAGAEMPKKTRLKAMATANPHGFGFATSSGKYFRTTDYKVFEKKLKTVTKDEACIMHFRLATHGSIKRTNCHPFASNGVYFAHNGVLPYASVNDRTDSEFAFTTILMPIVARYGLFSEELTNKVAQIIGSSRFAFMQGARVRLFGDWVDFGGCRYSNMRWVWALANIDRKCL